MQDIISFLKEHLILIILWFLSFFSALFLIFKKILFDKTVINNFQAIKLINKNNAIVIDTRSSEIFKKGHIINSINFPLKKIFLEDLKEIEIYKSFPIILILNEKYEYNNCMKILSKNQFNNVYFLKNGIYYWSLDHLPLIYEDK